MKILCAEYNDAGEVAVVPVGDDVLLRIFIYRIIHNK